MKRITILLLFFCMTLPSLGEVSTRAVKVCLSDGITPLELTDPCVPDLYRDVMVGTKLTFIVYSDTAEEWYGGGALAIEEEDMTNIGRLYGRPPIGENGEYLGSCLPDAGDYPIVWDTVYYGYGGFVVYAGSEPNAGDWFIFDYNALDIGDCNIVFYDFDINGDEPIHTLFLHHVPTRDFDGSTQVGFADFAVLAFYWQEDNCSCLEDCEGADLDTDGKVDSYDLMLFCEYWLEKTE